MSRRSSRKRKAETDLLTNEQTENNSKSNGVLSLLQIKMYVESLMDLTLCNDIKQLKNHKIPECVWKRLESKLKLNHTFLKNYWHFKLHLQLFYPEPIYISNIKIKLVKFLHGKKVTSNRNIDWYSVATYFEGLTSAYLWRLFRNMMYTVKKQTGLDNFTEQFQHLHDEYIPCLIKDPRDRLLPRLLYNNGVISYKEDDLAIITSSNGDEDLDEE